MYTGLTEIENALNSHPLTYLSDENFYESLPSFHMIHGKSFDSRCEINVIDQVKHCPVFGPNAEKYGP